MAASGTDINASMHTSKNIAYKMEGSPSTQHTSLINYFYIVHNTKGIPVFALQLEMV